MYPISLSSVKAEKANFAGDQNASQQSFAMKKEDIINNILKSPALPTLPAVATELISITSKEETTLKEIADLLSKDVSLSAKVLKIANSAYYGFAYKISTIQQAISCIGINAIRSLVLSFSFLAIKGGNKSEFFNYEDFLAKSLATAVVARLIKAKIDKNDLEEIFIAGLLKNIGKLILASTHPKLYDQIAKESQNSEKEITELEQEIIGIDHAQIGYEVTKNWGFPAILSIPILYHHFPERSKEDDKKIQIYTNVIYFAGLVSNILYSNNPNKYYDKFVKGIKVIFGLSKAAIDDILDKVDLEVVQNANYFGFHIKKPKPIEEILIEANTILSGINLTYDQMNKELVNAKVQMQKVAKELETKNKWLESLANIDGLTEVYNHRYLQIFLEREFNRTKRKKGAFCLIMLDVDNFKKFNDTYGHQAGDFILKELCRLLQKGIRTYDIIARYGGEEFSIVLPETELECAWIVAERLRNKVADHIFSDNKEKYKVTISIGIAETKPALDNLSKNDLIDHADTALLESKKNGKNRITVYSNKQK
ncbi:MAG: GGDEF domain-containing protein [Planctomycetes bacterium]|nr:GGDEF domain-containing protein [Planctomycetota bacterium]